MIRMMRYALVALVLVSSCPAGAEQQVDSLKYAKGAANWILSLAGSNRDALTWPVNDTDRKAPAFDLYYGMPGGILLIAELAKEDPSGPYAEALPRCVAGLEHMRVPTGILDTRPRKTGAVPAPREVWGTTEGGSLKIVPGLYSGLSGIAWLYLELSRSTGDEKYKERAREIVEILLDRGIFKSDSSLWDNSTDIISGASGTGLIFLRAYAVLRNPRCTVMAESAGDFLLEEAIQTIVGLKWKINSGAGTVYPNFAHGTAGVGYFLLRLYEVTKEKKYLDAAKDAVRELEANADENSRRKTCAWFHHEGDGEDLYYAGWCHGPAGTARLFYELARANLNRDVKPSSKRQEFTPFRMPDGRWLAPDKREIADPMTRVDCAANWLLTSGIPEPAKPIKGYWNEGICCGTAGVGEFFVDLYLATKKPEYLKAAERMALHLAKAAEPVGEGYRWIQAEDRISPQKKDAQTGYAQGAAGIGLFFLKLARAQRGETAGWQLPDNPFQD